MNKVSIIVPIYGVEKYLRQCVESIMNQTLKEIEIILVDDGSQDNCPQICDEYAAKDNRIIVIHKENGGLVSARQAGVEKASGYYVGFVDGDDWVEPAMFEKLLKAAEESHSDLAVCGFFYSYPEKEDFSEFHIADGIYEEQQLQELMTHILYSGKFYEWGMPPSVWNKLFVREKYIPCQMKVERQITLGEDLAVTIDYYSACKRICVSNAPYYHYRQITSSMVHAYDPKLEIKIRTIFDFLDKNVQNENFHAQLVYYRAFMVAHLLKNMGKGDDTVGELAEKYHYLFEDTYFGNIVQESVGLKLSPRYSVFFNLGLRKQYRLLGLVGKLMFSRR